MVEDSGCGDSSSEAEVSNCTVILPDCIYSCYHYYEVSYDSFDPKMVFPSSATLVHSFQS